MSHCKPVWGSLVCGWLRWAGRIGGRGLGGGRSGWEGANALQKIQSSSPQACTNTHSNIPTSMDNILAQAVTTKRLSSDYASPIWTRIGMPSGQKKTLSTGWARVPMSTSKLCLYHNGFEVYISHYEGAVFGPFLDAYACVNTYLHKYTYTCTYK